MHCETLMIASLYPIEVDMHTILSFLCESLPQGRLQEFLLRAGVKSLCGLHKHFLSKHSPLLH